VLQAGEETLDKRWALPVSGAVFSWTMHDQSCLCTLEKCAEMTPELARRGEGHYFQSGDPARVPVTGGSPRRESVVIDEELIGVSLVCRADERLWLAGPADARAVKV